MTQVARHAVAILGSGITGLSAAYYINRKFGPSVRPIILEASNRSGGWIQTLQRENNIFEIGPRTVRPVDIQGKNTLDLVEEIGLDCTVQFVPSDHPAAQNRMIYLNGELVRLPTDTSILFKTVPPFTQPLIKNLLKEIFVRRRVASDDSLHSFISRRFGPQIADTLFDPMIRGITAGDAREISVKFLAGPLYDLEQKYGSVILGSMLSRFRKKVPNPSLNFPGADKIGYSNLAKAAVAEKWSVWSLESGLEALPKKLEQHLLNNGIEVLKDSPVQSIKFDASLNESEVTYVDARTKEPTQLKCSQIISTIPAWDLSKIIDASSGAGELTKVLNSTPAVDVTVTNLKYNKYFPEDKVGFGFLVPSYERSLEGLLGIVFDTCAFPQGEDTVITVMSRGIDLDTIHKYVDVTLGLKNPVLVNMAQLQRCIPQYTVGHYERVINVRKIIGETKLPLILAGASFDGVSVNDCILSGRKACEQLPADLFTAV